MKAQRIPQTLILTLTLALSGCVVRTYQLTRERADQDLSAGNRGYLMGSAPQAMPEKERKSVRTTRVIEIELYSPLKVERLQNKRKARKVEAADRVSGQARLTPEAQPQKGDYITEDYSLGMFSPEVSGSSGIAAAAAGSAFGRYTVQKGDTLQKISHKLYGTSKKWYKIYQANKDVLKTPDKLYPGQIINIPVEATVSPQGSNNAAKSSGVTQR